MTIVPHETVFLENADSDQYTDQLNRKYRSGIKVKTASHVLCFFWSTKNKKESR